MLAVALDPLHRSGSASLISSGTRAAGGTLISALIARIAEIAWTTHSISAEASGSMIIGRELGPRRGDQHAGLAARKMLPISSVMNGMIGCSR